MFPPGTVRLEGDNSIGQRRLILQPRPTEDPNDPLNWPSWRKYLNFGLVGFYVIMVSQLMNSSGPTWGPIQKELGFSDQTWLNSYALSCAFLAIGSVFLIPFAHKFGRRPLYVFSSLVQCGVSIWSAKIHTEAELLLVNVLGSGFGALAEVIVQMTVADVFFVHQRGRLNSVYVWFWQIAASLGPFIAGYITRGQGWRWVSWWNAIFFGVFCILACLAYEETKFLPRLEGQSMDSVGVSRHKNDRFESEDPAIALESIADRKGAKIDEEYTITINSDIPRKTYWQRLALTTTSHSDTELRDHLRHVYRPLVLLATVPAITYTALVYGILTATADVMATSFSLYMTKTPYDFTPNEIGLMNLSKLVGSSIGTIIVGPLSDYLIVRSARRNQGIYEPERRLWSLVPFLALVPAGGLLFGFGLQNGLPWPVIAVALAVYKLGMLPMNAITVTYLTDSCQEIIGDAVVGVTIVRNTFSTIFVFALDPWVAAVGIKWVLITVILLATGILSLTVIFIRHGKAFRARTAGRYEKYASLQYESDERIKSQDPMQ